MSSPNDDLLHGPVHRLENGMCREDCPHPMHDGPISVVFHPALLEPLREWLDSLALPWMHFPTEPGTEAGMKLYVVRPPDDHPLVKGSPMAGKIATPPRRS